MEVLKSKTTWALGLLAMLMVSHLMFLGMGASGCRELIIAGRSDIPEQCENTSGVFQRAAETYIAIILALMAPLGDK